MRLEQQKLLQEFQKNLIFNFQQEYFQKKTGCPNQHHNSYIHMVSMMWINKCLTYVEYNEFCIEQVKTRK